MNSVVQFKRPSLEAAVKDWQKLLGERGFAPDLLWIFAENLCVEKSRTEPGGFHFGFQTRFTPPPPDALEIAFNHFCEAEAPIVFYRLGARPGKSVCMLLCDPWFANRRDAEGFIHRAEWGISFYPGTKDEIEEITDLTRWLRRIKRNRAFHDLDFAMTLEAIDETKLYGRALAPYERFAAVMLTRLRRFLGQPA
ncbi:MAG TPA: hypothetical protein VMB80_16030 [Candidatus Acidoferrum sp.]|nr:hypothetical protein [Candidatus Acidoferrum sp.]